MTLLAERDAELFRAWKNGDARARAALISGLMRIAAKVARKYARSEQDFEEFLSDASVGIVEAVDKYDGQCGALHRVAYLDARNRIVDSIRKRLTSPDTMSIHWCVTETIDEWKRAPDQEELAAFSELRSIAAAALTPPQFSILLRRTADQELEQVADALDMNVKTVSRYHLTGISRLAEAVAEDDE